MNIWMFQRRTGWKCCGQMRPKSSSLASPQLAMFGGGGMLPMTPRTPSHHQHGGGNIMLWGCFLLSGIGQTAPHQRDDGRGPCTVRARALKPARALKMGCRWGIPAWQWPKTHGQGNNGSGSSRSTLRSWSGLASLQTLSIENLWRELKVRVAKRQPRTLMTWRGSAKRSGTKSLLRCVRTWWPTTRNVWLCDCQQGFCHCYAPSRGSAQHGR